MSTEKGRSLSLSLPRRWVGDMVHFAKSVPTVAAERTMRVRRLMDARRTAPTPPSWYTAVLKGFAIVSSRTPELRRAYMPYPWPRLYEHPYSVAATVINRQWNDEIALCMCPILYPERRSLAETQTKLAQLQNDPFEKHGSLRRLVRNSRFPLPIRRALWATGLYASGGLRARTFGTFAINSVGTFRARMLQFLTPITTMLYVGAPKKEDGTLEIQIAFDHRVFDGSTAARAISDLEGVLNDEIATEIRTGGQPRAAA